VAASDEAAELLAAAHGDEALLRELLGRRMSGEPLAWITGETTFADMTVSVRPGVYVPRWQSMELVHRAIARMEDGGTAVDLCAGSGALAMALRRAYPSARILATDTDPIAVECARRNGIDSYHGDLFSPLPDDTLGSVNLVVAIAPYVPTSDLALLPRDTLEFEDAAHYDGGANGTDVLLRIVAAAPAYLVAGGALVLEVGGAQDELLEVDLRRAGFTDIGRWTDDDGDLRGIEATWSAGRVGPVGPGRWASKH
jgi:release factor glutamine methyltransferase